MVNGFKHTDVGLIPNDWETPHIKDFTDVWSGGTPSTKINDFWNGEIRWMNSGELNYKRVHEVEGRITELGLKNSATKIIPEKCVLVGLAGQGKTRGTVAMNYVPICTNQSIAAILPCKTVDEDYLYHNLDFRYKKLRTLSTGDGGRGGLNLTLLRILQIPLPPTKEEQTAIAQVLSDVDSLITGLEKLIAKKKKIKQGAMQELLKPKDGWIEKELGECLIKNPDYGINAASVPFNESLPVYLRITDISEDGRFVKTNICSVNHPLTKNYYLENGDLVFARTGASVGKTYLYNPSDGQLVFAGFLIRVKTNSDILNPLYLKYFTQTSAYSNWVLVMSMRTGQPGINGNEYKGLPISIPPDITEQTRIAGLLDDMDKEIEALEKQLDKYRMLKQGMMQKLLTGKIRLIKT